MIKHALNMMGSMDGIFTVSFIGESGCHAGLAAPIFHPSDGM